MTNQEAQLLNQLFDNQREETNRRFDELGKLMCSRFDKLENKFEQHSAEDAKNFEELRAEVVREKAVQATKHRFWGITASALTILIAAIGVWVAFIN